MSRMQVHISDHALVRHMELVMGLDVEAVRREIRRKVTVEHPLPGATGVIIDRFTYKIGYDADQPTITTVIDRRTMRRHQP
ncbi:hypothetical protein [Palleronia caenipelagi]|uniref:DUF4258 domain-containing protein n=1 Tax=Palleronia caenipelagi TaxID=2489174 RepID=A0A547PW86_9RHOB|nr:hypothetical protein [Palleronia caenipelagi]TRD18376.1 hypothetical protein FEV53_12020 [Palleronia caenipelagi]